MSDLSSEKCEMSAVSEAALLVQRIAEPRPVGDSIKSAIVRAARRAGFTFSRTRDIWYEQARRIDSEEMDRLRTCAARQEIQNDIEALAAISRRLALADAEFHRNSLDAIDDLLRRMGHRDGAVAVREE